MHRTALTSIAPEIYRKRLLVEGHFGVEVSEQTIRGYFTAITAGLGLRPYGPPIVHRTSGQGREVNEGFDGFVPLIDSGIYVAVWVNRKFMSTVIYTCGPFDEDRAVTLVRDYFQLTDHEAAIF
jgi:S-adenosylmethionine decarboxylase